MGGPRHHVDMDPEKRDLHHVVVKRSGVGPADDGPKVGPYEMTQLEQVLQSMGLPVALATRDHQPAPRRSPDPRPRSSRDPEPRSPRAPRDRPAPSLAAHAVSDTELLVLEWVGGFLADGLLLAVTQHMVKGWVAKRRGRKQSARATRQRSRDVARLRLGIEFAIELKGVEPTGEHQEPDGSWTITFHNDGHQYSATVPGDVDDLTKPDAVRLSRTRT